MLVLTRKADEQILIGDDIKITLVRVRGNSVRIGIDAPKDIRIVRGELGLRATDDASQPTIEREEVFARPEAQSRYTAGNNRIANVEGSVTVAGSVHCNTDTKHASGPSTEQSKSSERFVEPASNPSTLKNPKRAPLSAFVSAT